MKNRNIGALLVLVGGAYIMMGAQPARTQSPSPAASAAPASNVREITLVNIKYEGSNVWMPGPLVCKKGDHVKLTLINNVKDDPAEHGLTIAEFGVQAVVKRGERQVVEFDATKAGIFKVSCHLHLPHVGTQIVVLE